MKVGWTQRKSNVSILETIGGGRELMAVVNRRQMAFMGHMMRVNCAESLGVMSRRAGTGSGGKPR